MKKISKRINLSVFSSFIVVGVVSASTVAFAQQAPVNPAAGSTFDQRLAQRKQEQPAPIDEKTAKRLESVCTSVQAKIRDEQSKTRTIQDKRQKTYKKIDAKLNIAVGKLKLAEKDTYKLEQAHAKYLSSVADFSATLGAYQETLDDLVVINCKGDTQGFNALIKTMRAYQARLLEQSNAIQKVAVDTIKPTLTEYSGGLR